MYPHHSLHHISLVVPQSFDSVENIHNVLLLDHLVDTADGTKRSWTPPAGTEKEEEEGEEKEQVEEGGQRMFIIKHHHHHQIVLIMKAEVCELKSWGKKL